MVYGMILAGGSGKRIGDEIPKQYIEIHGKPLLYYTLRAFEEASADAVSVVADKGHLKYIVSEIADRYGLKKVIRVCEGGEERFDSVLHGLDDLKETAKDDDIILIHDGARPFIKPEEIDRMIAEAKEHGAAIGAMPVKDTIKISDEKGFVSATTLRANTWQIQTPQAFRYGLIREAYEKAAAMQWKMPADPAATGADPVTSGADTEAFVYVGAGKIFTDDSMVVEAVAPEQKIKLVALSYENIKITTPEDLSIAKERL